MVNMEKHTSISSPKIEISEDATDIDKFFMQALIQDRLLNSGMLMASVAHEINNPIAWILSNLNYLNKLGC